MRTTHSFVIPAALLLAGCGQTRDTGFSTKKHPPVDPREVVIYFDAAEIPGEYEKLARVRTWSRASTNEVEMDDALRKQAARMGANGVLYQYEGGPPTGPRVAGAVPGTGRERRGEVIAVFVFVNRPREAERPDTSGETPRLPPRT